MCNPYAYVLDLTAGMALHHLLTLAGQVRAGASSITADSETREIRLPAAQP